MSYLALARKWRPRTFSQLVGQQHINKVIIKSLEQQRLHHAYLFTGTRGVGKTSVSRLLAKALNCEQGISANPCLVCETCIAIEQGRFIDLIEIDGASKTKVEDTRELLENVQYAPTSGRFKIYLIDEVHMLSQHSFNALLKTLEEPPSHVKFLLATTDPQKLPITILSRCIQFNLKHLPIEVIVDQLKTILAEEKQSYEEDALQILAKAAQGSMRDALTLLDQAIVNADGSILANDVKSLLGYTQQDYSLQILKALNVPNPSNLIQISRQVATEGGYFSYVLEELLENLHQITLCQALTNQGHLTFSVDIQTLATQLSKEDVQLFYQIALKGLQELSLTPNMLIAFEMIVLRMLTFKPASDATAPTLTYETMEPASIAVEEIPPLTPEENLTPVSEESVDESTTSIELQESVNEIIAEQLSPPSLDWSTILQAIKLNGLAQNAAENAELLKKEGNSLLLSADKRHQSLFTSNVVQRLEQTLSTYFNETIRVKLEFDEEAPSSPAQKKETTRQLNEQAAEKTLDEDPFLQQLKQEFSAELVKNSIVQEEDQLYPK